MKLKLAVIGKDVSKSDSPAMHSFIADKLGYGIEYKKISIAEDAFDKEAEKLFSELDGFNVTIPFKLRIIGHLKKIEGDAEVFGAVNTVKCGSRTGFNTDGLGFELMLKNAGVPVAGKSFLLLGCGGAGRSVAKKLADGGAKVFVYDRDFESAQNLEREFAGVKALEKLENKPYFAIINATGVGMHKTVGLSPAGEELISLCDTAIDLIYVPAKSEFLRIAEKLGKKILNGKAMLFYQAYFAQCIYSGAEPDEAVAKELFEQFEKAGGNL